MKIMLIFPKDSEALFNDKSNKTFGGASVQMFLIAKELAKDSSLKIYSAILDYPKICSSKKNKFNIVKVHKVKSNIIEKIEGYLFWINKIKPDIVIQHGLSQFTPFLALYCKMINVKFVYMFASDVEVEGKLQSDRKPCVFFPLLVKHAFLLVTQNKHQKKYLWKKFKKKTRLIYNGFEIKNFSKKKKDYVLWVSRCEKLKRPELFIDIARMNPKIGFVMICPKTKDIAFFNKIKSISKRVKNLKFIEFAPFDKINSYFAKAKFFINTSEYEGFPQTFIQATMNSTPILSLNINPDDFIIKYNCGFYCNNDFNLMIENMHNLIKNENLLRKISKNAHTYAKNNHDIKKTVKILLGELNG
ncbi:MAG: glycosyltransferase [Candidatus Nanoarchaeia archaeon]|nr:glycosyltransferase [Candidatus Nanoarchaeia archaeon]